MPAATTAPWDRPTFSGSVARLRTVGKSNYGIPLYSRVVNRPLGRQFAALAHVAGMTPNQVTAISALLTFTAILTVGLVEPGVTMGIVVALLLALGYALDSSDGQLARLRGGGTLTGEWLDHMIDCAKNSSIHLAVLISLYRFGGDVEPAFLLLPAAFQVIVTVLFFGNILTEQLRGGPQKGRTEKAGRSVVRSVLVAPADYGLLCVAFACFGFQSLFLAFYAVLLLGNIAYLAGGLVRWRSQLAALDVERAAACS
ncbi:CDP-alcohol phosphatidyltransferase family protein [Blastococcus goldschmidtiae]|uniref:CDP-alcohol phosphatidyltransferase family protein n=1 Tax=Blastococcus goldschmidtiae TaxID=3075546 RepID=A0ABU2K684_9ACTN|nr:CDP-alcohol phosphatidyltransferase family protein [Blastococcus sp. DSM 46792]MDT0275711.1 CDP-alcohol phosphatidyltransferase family protein [Blastococcus sp. DSM 46792]